MSLPRLALTTTRDRAHRLGRVCAKAGVEPVVLPCIEVAPATRRVLDEARALSEESDWLLVTSSRAIDVLWPEGAMPETPVAAVGDKTAEAVDRAGGQVAVTGDAGGGRLIAELRLPASGRSVFFPHAGGADLSVVDELTSAGSAVTALEVYATTPLGPERDPVDGAVFASPSAVEGWSLTRQFGDVSLGAIGDTTARALADRGHEPDVVAPLPDFETLIDLMAEFLMNRSPV